MCCNSYSSNVCDCNGTTTLSITTFSIMTLSITIRKFDTQHDYAECHHAKCRCAEYHYAECRFAECHYAESHCAREIAVVQDLFNCLNHSINCHKLFTPASSKSFHAKILKVKVG